jgi:hypothetical protein
MLLLCPVLTTEAAVSPKRQQMPALHRRRQYWWSECLKCSFCIKNAEIINRHYVGTVRTQMLYSCMGCVPVLVLLSGREAAKFELRVAQVATGISASKCYVLQLLQHWQQVSTSTRRNVQQAPSLELGVSQINAMHEVSYTF